MKIKSIIALCFVLGSVSAAGYLMGGIAHKRCAWPFCRGGLQALELRQKSQQSYSGRTTEVVANSSIVKVNWGDLPGLEDPRQNTYSTLATHRGRVFMGNQEGSIYELTPKMRWVPSVFPAIDLGLNDFDEQAAASSSEVYSQRWRIGLRDLVVAELGDKGLVAYMSLVRHVDGCVRLSVVQSDEFKGEVLTLFDSPCLESVSLRAVGGGLALNDLEGRLYLSVGDMGLMRGVTEETLAKAQAIAMKERNFASIYSININTGQTEIMSIGLRGSTGLAFSTFGLWAVESGPQGGDELNLVYDGADYGWPRQTMGVQYGETSWPLAEGIGNSSKLPVFAFIPSVAPSDIAFPVQSEASNRLQSLYVSALRGRSIFKLLFEKDSNRVVTAERFEIGERIRSIASTERFLIFTTDVTGKFGWIEGGLP